MSNEIETDVLVLGGGVAGLACAVALKDQGLRLTVVEKDTLLGGRARSWADPTTLDPIHIGPHVLTNAATNFLDLLERLGTRSAVVWQEPNLLSTIYDHQRATELRASSLPAPLHFFGAMLRDPARSLRSLASDWDALRVSLSLDEAQVLELDRRPADEVLRELGVDHDLTQRTWQLASVALMHVPLAECSAGTLFRAFQQVVSRNRPQLGFPGCELGDLFAPSAQAALEAAGHRVLLGAEAAALTGGARATGARLADGRSIAARYW